MVLNTTFTEADGGAALRETKDGGAALRETKIDRPARRLR
jgi:hypothetical protein